MRNAHRASFLVWLALATPLPLRADVSAVEACEARNATLEKRLGMLQLRLGQLEHERSARPQRESAPSEAWRDARVWRSLRQGMSQADVLRLLGPPGRVTTYYGFQRWEYPDALGTRVNFDERGMLFAWGPMAR